MAVAIRSYGSFLPNTAGNYTYSGAYFPTGVTAGDVLLWIGAASSPTISDTFGNTWQNGSTGAWYTKPAVGTETSLTVSTAGSQYGMVLCLSGCAPGYGTYVQASNSAFSSTTTVTVTSIAVTRSGALVLCFVTGSSTTTGANPFIGASRSSPYTTIVGSEYIGGASGAWRHGGVYWSGTNATPGAQSNFVETISTAPTTTSRTGYYIIFQPAAIVPAMMLMGVGA